MQTLKINDKGTLLGKSLFISVVEEREELVLSEVVKEPLSGPSPDEMSALITK